MTNPHDIVIRPIVTEQSMADMADRKYTFVVQKGANKTEIKKAVIFAKIQLVIKRQSVLLNHLKMYLRWKS